MKHTVLFTALLASVSSLVITACNQNQETPKVSQAIVKKYTRTTFLEGEVSDNNETIKTGKVKASDENGRVITRADVDNGHYRIEIPRDTVLPVILTFTSNLVKEELVAVVTHDTITRHAINPTSTAIAKAAKAMGGYSSANMAFAAQRGVHVPDKNKTTSGWRGDPTAQYGGWH